MIAVRLRDVHKRFGATPALLGANLELEAGEIHALLGENGAGKTTLVNVLYGVVRPDAGEIWVGGRRVEIGSPRRALELGIGRVAQHFALIPALSVAENLALGDPRAPASRRALHAFAARILAEASLDLDPELPAGALAMGQKQRLEIARALARGARVLVLDEPTAVLAPSEVDGLLDWLRRLRAQGRSVVFISHKLEEIARVCDRVTVMRAGRTVGTRSAEGASAKELADWMLGAADPAAPLDEPAARAPGPPALRIEGLRAEGLQRIDLEIRAGEIVGVAGIDGNGQGPLEEVLAGVRPRLAGAVRVLRPPLALLPGDRQRSGLVLDLSVAENLALPAAARGGEPPLYRRGWLQRERLRECARAALAPFALRGALGDPVRALSGGNQQKVSVARALLGPCGVLVCVQPTRGLDLAASRAVRALLRERAREGAAVLLVSTDADEVLELADRVCVLFRGGLRELAAGPELRERLGRAMLGSLAP